MGCLADRRLTSIEWSLESSTVCGGRIESSAVCEKNRCKNPARGSSKTEINQDGCRRFKVVLERVGFDRMNLGYSL